MNLRAAKPRCVLILGTVILFLVFGLAMVFVPWWDKMRFYDDAATQAADHIQRYQHLIDSRPLLQKRLALLHQDLRQRNYFIDAANQELAAAKLQNRVKEIVTEAGGKLISTHKIDADKESDSREIKIKVRIKGDVDVLAKVLHELEGQLPIVQVQDISIRSRHVAKGSRANRVQYYQLDVGFDLLGYLLGGGK
ncbi:MAG TPA: hypothetical protein ENG92_06145 [Thiolapillus brandeum]|uniref:General secretion pathway protein GspM n=1 Tax=Thiolapillus brandeum TaxID=1076588 RepID=A0A831KCX5_9GAMM|nr:hypothetical protein [Thiolapillus brandeum]